ncbi:MAG: hypothetical protein JXL81_07840 [Deltaproteobacteria bacterium]|nr:hypothetical protein [Deltaproteobacteria bacterium]
MEIDKKILAMCKTIIAQKLGNIDDLPGELANTVVNVFYRSFELSFKWTESMAEYKKHDIRQKIPGDALASESSHVSSVSNITSYYDIIIQNKKLVDDMHNALRSFDMLINQISELRKINKETSPDLYNSKVNHILDVMKYKMKGERYSNPIIRAIQRNFNKKEINEIPDLYKLI